MPADGLHHSGGVVQDNHRARACVLLDEVDNLDLLNNPALRAVITSGHHCDGAVRDASRGRFRSSRVHAVGLSSHRKTAEPATPAHRTPLRTIT